MLLLLLLLLLLPPPAAASTPSAAPLRIVKLPWHVLRACRGLRIRMPTTAPRRRHPRRQHTPCASASRLRPRPCRAACRCRRLLPPLQPPLLLLQLLLLFLEPLPVLLLPLLPL